MSKIYKHICYICGKEYENDRPNWAKSTQFCSEKCKEKFEEKYPLIGECLYCKNKFHKIKSDIKFCSYDCKRLYCQENREIKKYICDNCGKEFETQVKKKNKYKFCSWKCYQDFDNNRNKRETAKCETCKKIFVKKYHSQRFCSNKCQNEWQSKERKMPPIHPKDTTIEILIKNELNNNNITFLSNYRMSYYEIDCYLQDKNLGIEIMGKYWHCDSRVYDKINNIQLKNIFRDKRKNTYIKNNKNFDILYLWEDDINNNITLCVELIKLYIKNNGKLKNYHSSNYHIDKNGKIRLNKNKVIPYMDLNQITLKSKLKTKTA